MVGSYLKYCSVFSGEERYHTIDNGPWFELDAHTAYITLEGTLNKE